MPTMFPMIIDSIITNIRISRKSESEAKKPAKYFERFQRCVNPPI